MYIFHMRTSVALLAVVLPVSAVAQRVAASVAVPDATAAVNIAEPVAIKVYGKKQIVYEQPLTAVLDDGVWDVYGTLCCPDRKGHRTCGVGKCVGGVVHVSIQQSDGKFVDCAREVTC